MPTDRESAAFSVTIIDEQDLGATHLATASGLLADAFEHVGDVYRERGWRTLRPAFRIICETDGQLVGQVSAFDLDCQPELEAIGLGDGVVASTVQRNGVLRLMMLAAIEECGRRQAEFIVTSTKHSHVGRLIADLGFIKQAPFTVYAESQVACTTRSTWWALGLDPNARSLPRVKLDVEVF